MGNGDFDLTSIRKQLCDAAFTQVIEPLLEGYICVGGTVAAQGGVARKAGGVDLVWDLWNEQFSGFSYPEHALTSESLVGAGGSIYVGFGFGRFKNVHEAWSGTFLSIEYSVDLRAWRFARISGQVQGFSSPDGKMKGGLAGVGGSLSLPSSVSQLFKLPLGGTVAAAAGEWTPYDDVTRTLSSGNRSDLQSSGRHQYLNLEEGELGVASHIARVLGYTNPLVPVLAAYAITVAMVKRRMEDNGTADDRAAGLRDLHLWTCSGAYRRIQEYKSKVPSGTSEEWFDGGNLGVQRTPSGNYIMTTTHSVPATGEWRSTRQLHGPTGAVIGGSYKYGMAISNAPNGFVDGRSYQGTQFTAEVGRRHDAMFSQ